MEFPKIYSYTVIRTATADFADLVPYCAVLIEMSDGSKKEVLLDEYSDDMEIRIGTPVKLVDEVSETYAIA